MNINIYNKLCSHNSYIYVNPQTFCFDAQVADSACSVTSYLGGTKANYGTIGLTTAVQRKSCPGQADTKNHVASLLSLAQVWITPGVSFLSQNKFNF